MVEDYFQKVLSGVSLGLGKAGTDHLSCGEKIAHKRSLRQSIIADGNLRLQGDFS